jgi:hypothetical protein
LWAEELGEHKLIAISRPPAELYLRYRSKNALRRYRNLAVAIKVLNRWIEHNSRIVAYLEQTQMDYLVMEYRRLMVGQGEFERLQAFVDRELVDQRRKDLYRHRPDREPRALQLAAWLIEKKTGQNSEKITAHLEEFRR